MLQWFMKGLKPFECEICSGKFVFNGHLKKHISSVHERIKPYDCKICNSRFSSKQSLDIHISSIHEGLRPFVCILCNAKFKQPGHLKVHVASVHKISNQQVRRKEWNIGGVNDYSLCAIIICPTNIGGAKW